MSRFKQPLQFDNKFVNGYYKVLNICHNGLTCPTETNNKTCHHFVKNRFPKAIDFSDCESPANLLQVVPIYEKRFKKKQAFQKYVR